MILHRGKRGMVLIATFMISISLVGCTKSATIVSGELPEGKPGPKVSLEDGGHLSCSPIMDLRRNAPTTSDREWWVKYQAALQAAMGKSTNAELEQVIVQLVPVVKYHLDLPAGYMATDETRAQRLKLDTLNRDIWLVCNAYNQL